MTYQAINRQLKTAHNLYSPYLHPLRKNIPINITLNTKNDFISDVHFDFHELPLFWNRLSNEFGLNDLLVFLSENTFSDTLSHQLAFLEAFERLFGVSDYLSENHIYFKMVIAEFERCLEHLNWLIEFFYNSNVKYLGNEVLHFKSRINRLLKSTTGVKTKVISPVLNFGELNQTWKGNQQTKLIQNLEDLLFNFSKLRQKVLFNPTVRDFVLVVGLLDASHARNFHPVGPIAKSAGLAKDLRVQDPYWQYGSLEQIKIAVSYELDLYGHLKVVLNETFESLSMIKEIVQKITKISPENHSEEATSDQHGHTSLRIETSNGPTMYNINCLENIKITSFGMSGPGLTNMYSLEQRLIGQPILHSAPIIHAYNLIQFNLNFE